MASAAEQAPANDGHKQGTEASRSELTKVVSAAEPAPANDEHVQGIEVDSSEQPIKIVSAAESAPSNDEHTAHDVHLKTAGVNMLTSSTTTDMVQDKIGSSAAYQSDAPCKDETTRQSDASLQHIKAIDDALARYTTGSIKDDNASHSEDTGVNVIGSKQDDVKIDDTQADDASRGSSSHLTADLQSTEPDQPPDQEGVLESTKERVKMEETLDKSSSDSQSHSQGNEISHDITLVRKSSENLNEGCSSQVDDDILKMKDNIAEVHAIMDTDGPEEALDASSIRSQKEASMADGVSTEGDTFETHAAMNTDVPEEARGASSTQSDKEVSMTVVDVPTDGSSTVCKEHNDLEGQVSCGETLGTDGGDNQTHCNTNDDSNNKNEHTMVNAIDDSNNKIEDSVVNPVDTSREPIGESTISVSDNSDLNMQSCTLDMGNDPPASTLASVEFNKVTGDAEILCAGRLESSGIETETVHIQEIAVADLDRTETAGDLDRKAGSLQNDAVLDTSCSMVGIICEKTPNEDLSACGHSEATSSLVAVEPTQNSTVANTVVFMDTCNTDPDSDSTIAEGAKLTVEVHTSEEQSAVPEHVEAQTKPPAICGPILNESPQTAGLEDQCSVPKHSGPTASSELVVPPHWIGETSAIQVEPEATKSVGYCTAEGGNASSETVMELEPNKETAVPMQEDTAEANDAESHECSEASLKMQSSEIKAASSIHSGSGSLSTQSAALPDETEQAPAATGVAPANDERMQVSEVDSSEQQTKMVSPANDEHVQDTMVHSSEQQTRMVSAAEFDALCVQETAIVDCGGARETVDLNDKSTHAPAVPGVEAHSSEQKVACSPGDEVNGSEQQTKIDSVTEIETTDVKETAIADDETPDIKEIAMADDETTNIKETAIADHEETGDKSGRSTQAPILTESREKGPPGTDSHGIESEVHYLEQIKMVSAVEPASALGCHMHEVHHTSGDDAILSSGEQDTLRDNIGSEADVDLPTSQRKTDFEGDRDHSTGIDVESTQGPCDASGNDHSTGPAATNLLMAESVNDTCDAEIGGKLESAAGGDIGTICVQEVANVANVEGTQGIGIEDHGSEQMKMVSVAQVASNMALVGYSSSEDSILDDSARAADDGDFADSKGTGVDGQETTSTQTASTPAENTDMDWQSCPLQSGNDSAAMIESDKDTGDAGIPCIDKIEPSSGVGIEMICVQETSIADQQGTDDLNEESDCPQRGDGCGTSCSTVVMASEKAPSGEGITAVVHSEVPTSVELVTAKLTQEATISNQEEIILYEKTTSREEPTVGSCSDAPTSVELFGTESTQEANIATVRGADRIEEVVKAAEEKPTEICGPMQEESIHIANLENDGSEPKDVSPTIPSERVTEPKQIDETCVMQVELATCAGDGCAAEDHNGVSSETPMESEPVQEIVVPMQEDGKEANDAATACEDLEGHAPDDVSMPVESQIIVPMQGYGSEANDTTTVSEVCEGAESHVSEHEARSMAQLDAVADDLPITVGGESTPGGANAKLGVADTEQKLLCSSGEAMVDISSERPNQEAEESSSADCSGNDENGKMEEAAATQGLLNLEPSHGGENVKLDEDDTAMQLPHSSGEKTMVDRCSEPPSNEVEGSPSTDPSVNIEKVKSEEADAAQGVPVSKLAHGCEADTELQLPFSSGEEPMADTCSELPTQVQLPHSSGEETMIDRCSEPPSNEVEGSPSTDPSVNIEKVESEEADAAQGVPVSKLAHGGEADTELQFPFSSGEEPMVDTCSELPSQDVKEAPSSDPSGSNEKVETENAAAAQGPLNTEPTASGEADTGEQLPPSGDAVVDISGEVPTQEVQEAPSTDLPGNDEDAKMEEVAVSQGLLNTESAHGGGNAKLGEAGTELQLPPSGDAVVEISSELANQEVKEAASTEPSGNDENAKMEEATAAAQVLLNAEPAPCEASRLAGADRELQLPSSGEAIVDMSSEPPSCQEVQEAPSCDTLGNDENSKTESITGAGGENTELGEADTEKQAVPVSAEVMVESSSELPNQEEKEATDLSGDDEKAKSARAAVVAELFGDATEGGLDQPLASPTGQGEDAGADGGVE